MSRSDTDHSHDRSFRPELRVITSYSIHYTKLYDTSYTNQQVEGDDWSGGGLGPTLSFGYVSRGSMVLLSGSWVPILGEDLDQIEGRIELAWLVV